MSEAKKMRSEASTSGTSGTSDGVGVGGVNGSVVVDVGRRKSTCGYCKSVTRTSISHGLWAHSLTVDDYQALLDRGWRRSGCFLYKPDMEKTCCPSYTIRLKASDFVPSKEQIRVSKRMQRFLDGKLDVKKTCNSNSETNTSWGSIVNHCSKNQVAVEYLASASKDKDEADQLMHLLSNQIDSSLRLYMKSFDFSTGIELPKASLRKVEAAKRKLQAQQSEELVFSCSISFQIAATLRRLKKDVRCLNSFDLILRDKKDLSEFSPNMIAEILASHSKQLAESHGLSVRGCNGHINYYASPNHADIVQVGRGTVAADITATAHSVEDRRLKKPCEGIQTQRRRLEVRLRRSCFDYEEYSLYRKYQLTVHNDKPDHVTESSYKKFLVDTPLLYMPSNGDVAVPPCGFGSFHQQYVIDGKLVAVGVIDILPKCLSSKYLFWDPDLAVLSLGKYSALQEIRCVNENQVYCPSLQYYYLGYYIHSCSKMRYKAAYRPSELLCPLRYQWVPYDTAKPLLDRTKYAVLSDNATSHNGELSPPDTSSQIEEQPNSSPQEASNDVLENDEEMTETDSDSSEDQLDAETSGASFLEQEDAGLSNVLIGLRGLRLNYKDIRHAFDPRQRRFMDSQLRKYVSVVGPELSEKMVYSLG